MLAAVYTWVAADADARQRAEEEMLQRMLTLQHRSLFGDRPLPLSDLDGGSSGGGQSAAVGSGACAAAGGGGVSAWAAEFAIEQAEPPPPSAHAATFAAQFEQVSRAFNDGQWGGARDQLYQLCLAGQSAAQAYESMARTTVGRGDGPAAAAASPATGAPAPGEPSETPWWGYARRLESWLQDCVTLVQYVPQQPPVREDHKRLLMLLHDLGGSLVLLRLLGALGEPLLRAEALGELGGFIAAFGEENRKTAVSRALLHAASGEGVAAQAAGAALLREHGLCGEAGGGGGGGGGGGARAAERREGGEADTWAEVGLRLCATLLLRSGEADAAVRLLKAHVQAAPTLHAYMGAFELASRVPPPRPRRPGAPAAAPLRFSIEQMLEVLEAALVNPMHGLATEGNLLRRQLRQSLNFGHPAQGAHAHAALPLACPPPPPAPRLAAPRIAVVVPFVRAERARLLAGLRRWAAEPSARPCEGGEGGGGGDGGDGDDGAAAQHGTRGSVDLILYAAGVEGDRGDRSAGGGGGKDDGDDGDDAWVRALAAPPHHGALGAAARCFRRVEVRFANLSAAQQFYIGGWDNTGPNNLFHALFSDASPRSLHRSHDVLFWMEADVYPVRPRWLERLREEAAAPRGFWRKGPQQQPALSHAMVSPHHYHMNSAGFYRLGDPCFAEFVRRVAAEHPRQPHDVSSHLFLHDPRHYHIFSRHAHRFLYTDLVQNRLDEWTLDKVRAVSPDTVFVHGKHAPFDVGKGAPGA